MDGKLFLTEINSLDNEQGCFASNGYFAEFFNLSNSRCSEIINALIQKNYVIATVQKEGKRVIKRILRCCHTYSANRRGGIRDSEGGYSEKAKDNNTIYNNTITHKARFAPPSVEEVSTYLKSKNITSFTGQQFVDFYESKDWMIGKNKMKNWQAAVRTWTHQRSNRREEKPKEKVDDIYKRFTV
jgi:hypothetical protein